MPSIPSISRPYWEDSVPLRSGSLGRWHSLCFMLLLLGAFAPDKRQWVAAEAGRSSSRGLAASRYTNVEVAHVDRDGLGETFLLPFLANGPYNQITQLKQALTMAKLLGR